MIIDDRGKPRFDVRYFRAVVGKFFEEYISDSFGFMTDLAKHHKLRRFDELLVQENGNQIEFTDVYMRYDNHIFLAEAKSTGIYDKEKYSGDLNEFYRGGRDAFFDSFGVNQIATAVKKLKVLVSQFDDGFPKKGTIKVFPAVIINEKALQTPLMAQVFNKRFKELIVEMEVGLKQIKLAPLAVIHISDLENIEENVRAYTNILEPYGATRFKYRICTTIFSHSEYSKNKAKI